MPANGTGVNVAVTSTPVIIFQSTRDGGADGSPCRVFVIDNTGGTDLRVQIPEIHGSDWGYVLAGTTVPFGSNIGDRGCITRVTVKTDAGSTTICHQPTIRNA